MTPSAKSSPISPKNKTAFHRKGHKSSPYSSFVKTLYLFIHKVGRIMKGKIEQKSSFSPVP